MIGYNQHANAAYGTSPVCHARRPRKPHVMTPLLQRLVDPLPQCLKVGLGVLAMLATAGFLIGNESLAAHGPIGGLIVAAVSDGAGFVAAATPPLLAMMIDVIWKVHVGLTYLAVVGVVLAGLAGLLYVVSMPFL